MLNIPGIIQLKMQQIKETNRNKQMNYNNRTTQRNPFTMSQIDWENTADTKSEIKKAAALNIQYLLNRDL